MTADTALLIAGIVLTVMTLAAFWYLWPQGGKSHPLLRTRLEPFIMVTLVSGLVLGAGMFFAGVVPG
jgi:hypothetical protein